MLRFIERPLLLARIHREHEAPVRVGRGGLTAPRGVSVLDSGSAGLAVWSPGFCRPELFVPPNHCRAGAALSAFASGFGAITSKRSGDGGAPRRLKVGTPNQRWFVDRATYFGRLK